MNCGRPNLALYKPHSVGSVVACGLVCFTLLSPSAVQAQEGEESPAPELRIQNPAAADGRTDGQLIIDQLSGQREPAPNTSTAPSPSVELVPSRVGLPASAVDLDPAVVGVLPGTPLPKLRREGEFIVERPGKLVPGEDGTYWVFAFEAVAGQPDLRPMIVLRCQRLASMQEAIVQQQPTQRLRDDAQLDARVVTEPLAMRFTLTGQVYTYRGINYLLPTAITGSRPPAAESSTTAADASRDDRTSAALPPPAEVNPLTPATFDGAGNPIDLMESLLGERRELPERMNEAAGSNQAPAGAASSWAESSEASRSINPGVPTNPLVQGVRPAPAEAAPLRREGEYLINRAGRLVRSASGMGAQGGVLFAFEADGQTAASAETPMLLQPCKLLELMEQITLERGDQVVFILSGRVYTYRGANYLLPTTLQTRQDWGNLQP